MRRLETRLQGPVLIEPDSYGDERGFLSETYRRSTYRELGVTDEFVQENHSRSRKGVVRGMHLQIGEGQAKLVRCARGSVVDVLVDVRRGSPSFGRWEAFELDDRNLHQLYVPIGFAHGFCVTSEVADVVYKLSAYYAPETERGFRYDDPEVGIAWPELELAVSERDSSAPPLSALAQELPFEYEG
jgi:dTDP-4-dehydrorhamnose 3,5-epimerase